VNLEEWAIANRDMVPHLTTLTDYASRSQVVVEFGVRGGVSTWALLDGLPSIGKLVSVDIDDCRRTVPDRIRNDDRWTFLHGDDLDPAIQAELPELADLVFIDTSHEYAHTVLELALAWAMEPNWILCHDADWPGVAMATAEFCTDHDWMISRFVEAHDEKGSYSLAVLEPAT
jgi:predicted O-methyltransferase YrrM